VHLISAYAARRSLTETMSCLIVTQEHKARRVVQMAHKDDPGGKPHRSKKLQPVTVAAASQGTQLELHTGSYSTALAWAHAQRPATVQRHQSGRRMAPRQPNYYRTRSIYSEFGRRDLGSICSAMHELIK
jgi:hypothetical protein